MSKIIYVIVFFTTAVFFQNCSNEFEIQEKPTLAQQNNNSNSNLNTNSNDSSTNETQDPNMELPLSTNCAPAASNVIEIDTLLPNNPPHGTGYGRLDFMNNSPDTSHAFKFRVGTGKTPGALASGSVTATAMTGGQGKHVLITNCPNDTTPINPRCDKWAAESTRVDFYVNLVSDKYCILEAGKTYYAKVYHHNGAGLTTCGSPGQGNCNFSMTMTSPADSN